MSFHFIQRPLALAALVSLSAGFLAWPPVAASAGQEATELAPEVRQWIAENGVELAPWESFDAPTGIEGLDAVLGDGRIIGLGEATHGSRELFGIKHRVLAELVQNHEVVAVGMEAGFCECLDLDAYVRGEEGDARTLLGALGPIYATEEILAIVEWLRAVNTEREPESRVRFLGLDVGNPALAARRLDQYLDSVDEEYAEGSWGTGVEIADLLTVVSRTGAQTRWTDDHRELLEILLERFETEEEFWIEIGGDDAFRVSQRLLAVLQQVLLRALEPDPDHRDRQMGEQGRWMSETLVPDGRVVLWMHNAHIARNGYNALASSGGFLAADVGEDYVALGTVFSHGGFRAISGGAMTEFQASEGKSKTFDGAFGTAGFEIGWWNLRPAADHEPMRAWLESPLDVHFVGGAYSETATPWFTTPMLDAFDAVFFVRVITASRGL